MKRDWLWVIAALFILAAGFFAQKFGLLDSQQQVTVVVSDCDLRQGGCELEMRGNRLQFRIEPEDIQILQPLKLVVNFRENAGNLPEKASVEFEGINMDMGYNRILLQPAGSAVYQGQGMLPACTADTMYWRIHLLLEEKNTITDFQFQLQTQSPGFR